MPKYKFTCDQCNNSKTQFANLSTLKIRCDNCGNNMDRQLPVSGTQTVTETVDSFTGVKHIQDQKELLKERRDQYYWEVEVPRLIQTYSIETCLEQGWLTYNDKGELIINKPPSKR